MQNRQRNIIFTVVAILLVGLVLYFLFAGNESNSSSSNNSKPSIISNDWEEYYEPSSKAPYSLGFFYSELTQYLKVKNKVALIKNKKQWNNAILNDTNKTFLFIGKQFGLVQGEMDSLLLKVSNGSDLIIFAEEFKWENQMKLLGSYVPSYQYQKSVKVYSSKDTFEFHHVYQGDTLPRIWDLYSNFDEDHVGSLKVIYSARNYPLAVSKKHGKGQIVMSHSPYLLQNFHLIDKDGFRFAKDLIGRIDPKKSVQILDIARSNEFGYDYFEDGNGEKDESYWQFLLQQKTLLMALLLALGGILLLLIFRSKRIELLVPYIPKKKNRSLSFLETISSLYLQKNNPKAILQIQKKNFYNTIQKHFYIDLIKDNNELHIESLAHKTKIPVADVKLLIALLEETNYLKIDDEYVIDVAKKQRNFYVQSKIIKQELDAQIWTKEIKIYRNVWLAGLLVLLGLFFVVFGFGMLVNSRGIGVAFWPLGIFTFYLGLIYLNKEIYHFTKESVTYNGLFVRPKTILWSQLQNLEFDKNFIQIKSVNRVEILVQTQLLNSTQLFLIQKMLEKYK